VKRLHTFRLEELQQLAHEHAKLKRGIVALRATLEREEALLNTALHELALERGEDPRRFALRWRREKLAPMRKEAMQ